MVATPTIISVDMNKAICAYPAPAESSAAARGKATKPGIRVMLPTAAAMSIPRMPESDPRSLEIISSSRNVRIRPIIIRTVRMDGNMLSNDFQAFLRAAAVFFLSLMKEKSRNAAARA